MKEYIKTSVTIKFDSRIYTLFRRWIEVWEPIIAVVGTNYDLYGLQLRNGEKFIRDIVKLVDTFDIIELHDLSRDAFEDISKLRDEVVKSIDNAKRVYEMGCNVNGFNPKLLLDYVDLEFDTINGAYYDSDAFKDGVDRQINDELNVLLTQATKKPQGPQCRVLKEHELPPPPPPKRYLNLDASLPDDYHPIIVWIDKHIRLIAAIVASIFVLAAVIMRAK